MLGEGIALGQDLFSCLYNSNASRRCCLHSCRPDVGCVLTHQSNICQHAISWCPDKIPQTDSTAESMTPVPLVLICCNLPKHHRIPLMSNCRSLTHLLNVFQSEGGGGALKVKKASLRASIVECQVPLLKFNIELPTVPKP